MPGQKLSSIILLLLLCQCAFAGEEPQRAVACEKENVLLSCHFGLMIRVITANYGRTNHWTCTKRKPKRKISNTACILESSALMSRWCDKKNSCSVPAKNWLFSDPCRGTYKYLNVSYVCE